MLRSSSTRHAATLGARLDDERVIGRDDLERNRRGIADRVLPVLGDAVVGQRHDGGRVTLDVGIYRQRHDLALSARELVGLGGSHEADERHRAIRLVMNLEVAVLARRKKRRRQRRRAGEAVYPAGHLGRRAALLTWRNEADG